MRYVFLLILQLTVFIGYAQLKGKVVAVSDGDTFTLLTSDKKQVKIRLHGIDAPEHGQDYATAAQDFLGDLVFGEEVYVEEKNKDHYGRTIGMVWLQKKNINEELLKAGFAWHYKEYDKSTAWSLLEQEARKTKKGLWTKSNPTAPWSWRKSKK